jgi:hypothetical protein
MEAVYNSLRGVRVIYYCEDKNENEDDIISLDLTKYLGNDTTTIDQLISDQSKDLPL